MAAQLLAPARPGERSLSPCEQAQRTEAMGCLIASSLPCSMRVNVCIIFDGVNSKTRGGKHTVKRRRCTTARHARRHAREMRA